jgi:hypothetical protein
MTRRPWVQTNPAPGDEVVCVKFSKREITYELGKGLGLFTNAGGEVAAARAPEGESSGADAKSE